MVDVVVVGAGPEWEEVVQTPGEVVAAVGVDGLEEAADNPHVHSEEVEITGDGDPENGTSDGSQGEKHNLDRRSVLSGQTERRRVGVVELVDHLVKGAVVQSSVEPVMPGVLEDEENSDVEGHLAKRGEGDAEFHAEVGRDGVEQPDLR